MPDDDNVPEFWFESFQPFTKAIDPEYLLDKENKKYKVEKYYQRYKNILSIIDIIFNYAWEHKLKIIYQTERHIEIEVLPGGSILFIGKYDLCVHRFLSKTIPTKPLKDDYCRWEWYRDSHLHKIKKWDNGPHWDNDPMRPTYENVTFLGKHPDYYIEFPPIHLKNAPKNTVYPGRMEYGENYKTYQAYRYNIVNVWTWQRYCEAIPDIERIKAGRILHLSETIGLHTKRQLQRSCTGDYQFCKFCNGYIKYNIFGKWVDEKTNIPNKDELQLLKNIKKDERFFFDVKQNQKKRRLWWYYWEKYKEEKEKYWNNPEKLKFIELLKHSYFKYLYDEKRKLGRQCSIIDDTTRQKYPCAISHIPKFDNNYLPRSCDPPLKDCCKSCISLVGKSSRNPFFRCTLGYEFNSEHDCQDWEEDSECHIASDAKYIQVPESDDDAFNDEPERLEVKDKDEVVPDEQEQQELEDEKKDVIQHEHGEEKDDEEKENGDEEEIHILEVIAKHDDFNKKYPKLIRVDVSPFTTLWLPKTGWKYCDLGGECQSCGNTGIQVTISPETFFKKEKTIFRKSTGERTDFHYSIYY